MSEEPPERRDEVGGPAPDQGGIEPEQPRPRWKTILLMASGGIAIATAAVVATLAATHNVAVAENAKAYINGLTDGLDANARAYLNGFVDGLDDPYDY